MAAIIIFIIIAAAIAGAYWLDFSPAQTVWGVTFSSQYAADELGLDWKAAYLAILDDLKVDHLRLSAYWNSIETVQGKFDFTDLDYQVKEAQKRQAKIILAIGRRLPRWPECHDPSWIGDLNAIDLENAQLNYVKTVINRYKDNGSISYFQIENEPYLSTFGVCPAPDEALLKQEISAAKELSDKTILVTDSGELSTWWPIAHAGGDILGTTLYRVVYNQYIGYFKWFTPPAYYWARVELLKKLTPIKRVIVAELQGEAWHKAGENLKTMSVAATDESMSLKQFTGNISFARRAGFDEVYLWGAEWWYFMKVNNNQPGYWQEAKKLWAK